MNDMEKPTFEESLREAFKGAEAGPSDNVWNNIELDLMKVESGKMKRRVLFYQFLAAASITFALLTIGISWYSNNPNNAANQQIASSSNPANDANDSSTGTQSNIDEPRKSGSNGSSEISGAGDLAQANDNVTTSGSTNTAADRARQLLEKGDNYNSRDLIAENGGELVTRNNNSVAREPGLTEGSYRVHALPSTPSSDVEVPQPMSAESITRDNQSSLTGKVLPGLYNKKELHPQFGEPTQPEPVADPGLLLLAQLKDLENELAGKSASKKKGSDLKENLWTSVGFAAGGFNTTNPRVSSSSPANMAYSNTVDNQSKASGVSYSFGLSMGTRLSERIVLQGGVNYLTQNSNYMSEQVVSSSDFQNFKAATLNDFRESSSTARVISTAPYSVNNNVEFVSVPMQAGYVLINRKFALQLNAGVSTDLYLKNTIDPEGSGLEKTTQERGAQSPYRSLNFSGLMNTELSYRLSNRYRISLNPGLRYPFNSIYKDEIGIDATPLTFDVGLRFKYIFQ